MNGKILLNPSNAIFHPNIPTIKDLPFSYALHRKCGATGAGMRNFHEDLELIFVMKETADIVYGDKVYQPQAGDVIVINSYAVHQMIDHTWGMAYFGIMVHSEFCKYNSIDITNLSFTEFIHDDHLNQLLYKLIDNIQLQSPYNNAKLKLNVLEILVYLYCNYSSPQTAHAVMNEANWKYVYKAMEFIRDNISKKITVKEVAAYSGLSEYYFMHEFKRITGYTLTNYINIGRCEFAKELLHTGQHKIKEISQLCGFDNENYFTKVFKKHTGFSPSEYIKPTP